MKVAKAAQPYSPYVRSTLIQVTIIVMFFISIFANIVIMLHSHDKEKRLPSGSEVKAFDISDLSSILAGNITGSKRSFARFMEACIKERIPNRGGTNSEGTNSMSENDAVLSLDETVLSSLNRTLLKEMQRQQKAFQFLSRPVINKHEYPYVHNPKDACLNRKIDIVFAVSSAPENFENRLNTRQGLKGSYSAELNNNATLLFFIGRSNHHNKSRRFQVGINMEMRRFGDIVQEDFLDEYKNATLKSVAILKFVSVYCPGAQFVIKTDDNVGVKPSYAVQSLRLHRRRFGNFILGRWNTMNNVQRKPDAKNYVSFKDYPYATFPPHVLGGAMGFPVSTAKLLYEATRRLKPVLLDDVYISGICAPLVNVPTFMDLAFDFKIDSW